MHASGVHIVYLPVLLKLQALQLPFLFSGSLLPGRLTWAGKKLNALLRFVLLGALWKLLAPGFGRRLMTIIQQQGKLLSRPSSTAPGIKFY